MEFEPLFGIFLFLSAVAGTGGMLWEILQRIHH
jgi:hypothetical protein